MSNCLTVQQLLRLTHLPQAAPGKTTAADLHLCAVCSTNKQTAATVSTPGVPSSRRLPLHHRCGRDTTAPADGRQPAGSPTTLNLSGVTVQQPRSILRLTPPPLAHRLPGRPSPSASLPVSHSHCQHLARRRAPRPPSSAEENKNLARKPTTRAEILLIVSDISLRQLASSSVHRSVEKKSEKNHLESP